MDKPSKKTAKAGADKPAANAAREGEKTIGPGVFKRAKRDASAAPAEAEVPSYTPSEQFFRRR